MIIMIAKPINAPRLLDEVLAAVPALVGAPVQLLENRAAGTYTLVVPDGTDPVAINNVIAAHDSTQLSLSDQHEAAQRADLNAFPTSTQVAATLTQIDADLVTLGGALTLVQAGPILKRTVQNQRVIIRALAVLVRRTS